MIFACAPWIVEAASVRWSIAESRAFPYRMWSSCSNSFIRYKSFIVKRSNGRIISFSEIIHDPLKLIH